MLSIRFLVHSTLLSTVATLATPAAYAQEADENNGLEEIVVTAQKRQTNLQDTPIAITALTSSALSDRAATRIEDIAGAVPNVYIDQRSLRSQAIAIRGLSADLNNPGLDQSVGIYVDGVYLGRATPGNASLFDLERVEVLRGPQGALYGKNTIAGAINYISKLPDGTLRGSVQGGYGNYDAWSLRGVISGPIAGDKIAASIAASVDQRDGLTRNLTTGNLLDDLDSLAARGTLLFRPSTGLEIVLRGDISRDRAFGVASDIFENGVLAGSPLEDTNPFDRLTTQDFDSTVSRDVWGVSGDINWDLGNGKLTSITAYRGFKWKNLTDNDNTALFMLNSGIAERQNQLSQELRYAGKTGALDFVVGGYYFHQSLDTVATSIVGPDLGIYPDPVTGTISADVTTRSLALFGQGEYHFSDRFSISVGMRYTDESKSLVHSQVGDPFELLLATYPERKMKRSEDNFSPSASINFKPSDDVLLYGSYSRGFKSGGFNAFSITPTSNAPFEPEYVDNFELGLKSTLLDGRARFNLALFWMNYRDLQVNQLLLISGVPRYETSNAARARSRGLEAEFAIQAAPGVEIAANYSMLDAKFVDYQNATTAGDDYSDNRLPGAPRHSGSVSVQYDNSIRGDWNLFARAELVARSSIFFAVDNSYSQSSVGLLNGRIGLHTPDGPWGIYLWGRNLTDRKYVTDRYDSPILPGQVGHILANPRMYGVELKLSF